MTGKIIIRGAREHNLKNIDIDLPRDRLIVITGLSGSGKSSLAFDTIYAEGQRRYVESLSAYARQFLELMQKPDIDSIEGLSPAISIEQKTTSRNPRSTVGTVTEIYDYMRLLWARVGVPYSPATGLPIEAQTVSQMTDQILALPRSTRLYLLAPVVRGRKGEYRKELKEYQKRGFLRVKIDGTLYEIDAVPALDKKRKHSIEVVVDRLVVEPGIESRLADSLETCLALADGLALTEGADDGQRLTFSASFSCPVSGFTLEEVEPRLFSFNNPFGACPDCDGLGFKQVFDVDLLIPDGGKSLREGAILPWSGLKTGRYYMKTLEDLDRHYHFGMGTPWRALAPHYQKIILYGSGKQDIQFTYDDGFKNQTISKPFEGLIPNLQRRFNKADIWLKEEFSRYLSERPCESCGGKRLKAEALSVKIDGLDIAQASRLSIIAARRFFAGVEKTLTPKQRKIAERIVREIDERLEFLIDVGLDYLTLSRNSRGLSGGESQRIRLASQIGSRLTGVLYVLDEPSIGLHQRDNQRLLETLERLRDLGNTVIVVEHDADAILNADYLLDLGPGAGLHGGSVVAQGTPKRVMAAGKGLTAHYLTGKKMIPVPHQRRLQSIHQRTITGDAVDDHDDQDVQSITLKGARANNLRDLEVVFPLRSFICVTGVSGGGKSTLVIETLYKALARSLNNARDIPGDHDFLEGTEHIDKVIDIDQSPIGRTPRSNPATYTGAFTPIRDWFAELPESRSRGYKAGRFSFNVKGGRCEACQGEGMLKIEMHFLPDIYVECDQCKGRRYNRETLEIKFKNKSISDVLNMTVEEGSSFFQAIPAIRNKIETLRKVGLGYIKIGQAATTLSGGEAQRVKLARELAKRATGKTVYILDEPTTGLHFDDVRKLLEVLHALVDQGNTVIIIEHNLEVIKTADWVIDLGPEGGDRGGKIVVQGTPEQVAATLESYTGQFLAPVLKPSQ